LNDF
jgi:transposase InsO family protein